MTKILVAVPFGLGIFIGLALLPGYQGYAAALASYGGMMLALMGWTPMPIIAKIRSGEGASILTSIKAPFSKIPFLKRGASDEPAAAAEPAALDAVDSVLAELAAAAEEDAPVPPAGLGDVVEVPAAAAAIAPEPVAVAAVVAAKPSKFPFFAKLLAYPTALLAKLRPRRGPPQVTGEAAAVERVVADANPAPGGLLARVLAPFKAFWAKITVKPDAEADAAEMAAQEATALAIEAGEASEPPNASLLVRGLAPFKAVWSKITVKPDAADVDDAVDEPGEPTLALAAGDADVEPAQPTPSKPLRQRVAAMRALLPADLSVAGIKRSTIATATRLIARARALNVGEVMGAAGRVPAIVLFAVIVVAALPLLLADLGATYARNWWADRADRNDDDFGDDDLDLDIDGPPADAEPFAQAA